MALAIVLSALHACAPEPGALDGGVSTDAADVYTSDAEAAPDAAGPLECEDAQEGAACPSDQEGEWCVADWTCPCERQCGWWRQCLCFRGRFVCSYTDFQCGVDAG
jgi:hypothetical protein